MNLGNKILFLFLWVFALGLVACSNDSSDGDIGVGLSLSTASQTVSELGESFTVTVESGGPWVSSCDEWLSVSPENGAGGKHPVTITVQPQENGGETSGKVVFTLADGSDSKELLVLRGEPKPGRKTDSLALVSLYNATNGNKWKTQWNFKLPMYQWEQVQMESVNGEMRVTEVMLKDFGLKGMLSDAIKYMDQLTHFSVETNAVSGTFPEFLCDMKQLKLITLAENNFSGELPAKLFELPNLVYLVLHGNDFSGKLPDNIGDCKSLQTLYLQLNNFTGEIPASFSKLKELRSVLVNSNHFYGELPDFTAMDSLKDVEFSRNGVFKDVPEIQKDLRTLVRRVYVSGGFTGNAPHFANKAMLRNVWLFENNLSSSPKFTDCPNIEQIRLNNNPIGSLDVSVVTNLEQMTELFLFDCGLTQLPEFSNCPKLKFLVLDHNKLTQLPESISELTGMEECLIENNELTSIPEGIATWNVIRHIYAGYNKLTSVPAAIWTLPLYHLHLQCNEISAELPASFVAARNLRELCLDVNHFYGSVKALATISGAVDIQCSQNEFSGELPVGLGRLTLMEILTLDDNDLTGSIPEDMKNCRALKILILFGNKMSGPIPEVITRMWDIWDPQTKILPQQYGMWQYSVTE